MARRSPVVLAFGCTGALQVSCVALVSDGHNVILGGRRRGSAAQEMHDPEGPTGRHRTAHPPKTRTNTATALPPVFCTEPRHAGIPSPQAARSFER